MQRHELTFNLQLKNNRLHNNFGFFTFLFRFDLTKIYFNQIYCANELLFKTRTQLYATHGVLIILSAFRLWHMKMTKSMDIIVLRGIAMVDNIQFIISTR